MKLEPSFYQIQDVTAVARGLLGKVLVTMTPQGRTAGIIVETEAYSYRERGCHAYQNRMTDRNRIMFATGGVSYVYLIYGIHHMFNIVTNMEGLAEAVLIRALEPIEGIELMQSRMGVRSLKRITSGPGKLAKALGIDRKWNGKSLQSNDLWIEATGIGDVPVTKSRRIGIDYAGRDANKLWRFSIKGNTWVSQ
ncbi:MAG TPA: DNA-3-methyladenine glycosylase [Cyclobacteriaceae bacterium]|nr:DNA-3-methyladenine glycosylase [Cyclobacteriaceae bacterium]